MYTWELDHLLSLFFILNVSNVLYPFRRNQKKLKCVYVKTGAYVRSMKEQHTSCIP